MGLLDGKVAIVTGAGRGIGREIAVAFAREGARVSLAARTEAQLGETAARIADVGGTGLTVVTDVAERTQVEQLVARTEAELGPVDVLMNNAGSFNAIGPVMEVDPARWWQDVTTNLLGTFLCCRSVLAGMVARGSGIILNMTGGGTANAMPYGSGYGTSKAGIMRFTESLDREIAGTGVVTFAMGPGLVRTAMTELQLETEAGRRWMSRIKDRFAAGDDVPPTLAANLAVELATGRYAELHGRSFNASDDLAAVLADKDRIIDNDLRTLRMV